MEENRNEHYGNAVKDPWVELAVFPGADEQLEIMHTLKPCLLRGEYIESSAFFRCSSHDRNQSPAFPSDCKSCAFIVSQPDPVSEIPQTEESVPKKKSLWHRASELVTGGIGVGKAFLGVDASEEDVLKARWAICHGGSINGELVSACDQHHFGQCKACGCFIAAKIRIAGESCPLGKW